MGQQQLLLLVLGIVIVGLAVVVGIQAFGENQKKANADALVNDGVRIASDAQAWKLKPKAFGGGSEANGFTGLSLAQLGYVQASAGTGSTATNYYKNLNGSWTVAEATGTNFKVVGCNSVTKNEVTVDITGTDSSQIATAVETGSTCTQAGV